MLNKLTITMSLAVEPTLSRVHVNWQGLAHINDDRVCGSGRAVVHVKREQITRERSQKKKKAQDQDDAAQRAVKTGNESTTMRSRGKKGKTKK